MEHICPHCKHKNTLELNFEVKDFVCESCNYLIDTRSEKQKKMTMPVKNAVLKVGDKGSIENIEYTVIAIVVKVYGKATFWREYHLKDKNLNNAYLSEFDGHWVFLKPWNQTFNHTYRTVLLEGKVYLKFETTVCSTHAATGFFEDDLDFSVATYKEFVNGTNMISFEQQGKKDGEYFLGKHISKSKVKKAFGINSMPYTHGIGLVQPFYVNTKQMVNIFGVFALLICVFQLYIYSSRTNSKVYEEIIGFEETKNKELVTKSFTLEGGSAPLKVFISSPVSNSWANLQMSLVNEETNEITYTSQDIEEYHGYEDGESWSEGGTSKQFTLCGVPQGKYHFVFTAENEAASVSSSTVENTTSTSGKKFLQVLSVNDDGSVNAVDETGMLTTYSNMDFFKRDSLSLIQARIHNDSLQKANNENLKAAASQTPTENTGITVKVYWEPYTLRNILIILIVMGVLVGITFWGRYLFEKSKWSNSPNTPYPDLAS